VAWTTRPAAFFARSVYVVEAFGVGIVRLAGGSALLTTVMFDPSKMDAEVTDAESVGNVNVTVVLTSPAVTVDCVTEKAPAVNVGAATAWTAVVACNVVGKVAAFLMVSVYVEDAPDGGVTVVVCRFPSF